MRRTSLICWITVGFFPLWLEGQVPQALEWLEAAPKKVITTSKGGIPVLDFEGLRPLLEQEGDQIHVVNFWATWCAPCIKELPLFEALADEFRENGVVVTLVSLDFPSMWEERLPAFVEKKNLQSPIVILDDPDQNSWIPAVSSDWSGAIPATLIYKGNRREFYEQGFEGDALEAAIKKFMNP